jgi:hypothetical protein
VLLSALDQADEQCEDDRANDGLDHATLSRKADGAHDESTNDRADDAEHDIHQCPLERAKAL